MHLNCHTAYLRLEVSYFCKNLYHRRQLKKRLGQAII